MPEITPAAPILAAEVRRALAARRGVVALESTVIAHGLPAPLNLETALACQEAVCQQGAEPATLAIIDGQLAAGLSDDQLRQMASRHAPNGEPIDKVSWNNLAAVMARRGWGATTVAASLRVARLAGLRVLATGGIGGVHRGAAETGDISADLTALAETPLICVAAGAKAILDLPRTLEVLETLGVPVIGYGTSEFPAFYSRSSGLPVDARVETPEEAARLAALHWSTGGGAVLICAPVPREDEIPAADIERAVVEAARAAEAQGVRGKAVTPFLLAELERRTGGATLAANRSLLVNNARIAAQIAVALASIL